MKEIKKENEAVTKSKIIKMGQALIKQPNGTLRNKMCNGR